QNDMYKEVLTTTSYYVIFKGLFAYFDNQDSFDISSFSQYIDGGLFSIVVELDNMLIHDDSTREKINDYLEDLSGIRNSEKEKQSLYIQLQEAENDNDIELQAR